MTVTLQNLEPRESLHSAPVGDSQRRREVERADLARAILTEDSSESDGRPGPPTQARLLQDRFRSFVSGLGAQDVLQTNGPSNPKASAYMRTLQPP